MALTKKEAARLTAQENTLLSIGFTTDEAESLRRISRTLRRWFELECGTEYGVIERDDTTGKPYWVNYSRSYLSANDPRCRSMIADREAGALRRLNKIMRKREELKTYIQTDPRGAALYILRPGDVPTGSKPESCYTNGICVF